MYAALKVLSSSKIGPRSDRLTVSMNANQEKTL